MAKNKRETIILTPPIKPIPKINCARVFGVRPNNPILFRIATSGERPIEFTITNLPVGMILDKKKGILSGSLENAGNYQLTINAENKHGLDQREITIKVGDQICLTPPMGWNSWYVNSLWVSQEKVQSQVQALYELGLADHGWTYINIDDGWQGFRNPHTNILEPNAKFPDMKYLCDYAHQFGIKIGFYSTPWLMSYAGYIGGSSPNETHDYSSFLVDTSDMTEQYQILGEKGRKRKKLRKFGNYMGDFDAKQWADWGIDYLKYDWRPNDIEQTTKMRDSLIKQERDIVFALSNTAPYKLAPEWQKLANVWRTTTDIIDRWFVVKLIGSRQRKWRHFGGPGNWNDPDMLMIGQTATPHTPHSAFRKTRLSPHEQYSQMSLWCLLSAPLLLSCDIPSLKNDPFTMSLLTNDEVLEINQDPLGIPAQRICRSNLKGNEIWIKNLYNGNFAIGIFNNRCYSQTIKVDFNTLNLSGQFKLRDLWRQMDLGIFENNFSSQIEAHGVILLLLSSNKSGSL